MVRLCIAPEELPPVDGPARLFVEHPPAGEGPGRHERRIPLRLGNPSTVHHFNGTRPRAANDFEWDPHHPLASCEQCSATIRLGSILRHALAFIQADLMLCIAIHSSSIGNTNHFPPLSGSSQGQVPHPIMELSYQITVLHGVAYVCIVSRLWAPRRMLRGCFST